MKPTFTFIRIVLSEAQNLERTSKKLSQNLERILKSAHFIWGNTAQRNENKKKQWAKQHKESRLVRLLVRATHVKWPRIAVAQTTPRANSSYVGRCLSADNSLQIVQGTDIVWVWDWCITS